MGIDKETNAKFVSVWITDNKEVLDKARKLAKEDTGDDEDKQLIFDSENIVFDTEEYYYDDGNNEFTLSLTSNDVQIYLSIPLSDTVLIDILQHSIKKLGKLKTALETLK